MTDLRNLWKEQDMKKRMALQDYMQTFMDKTLTADYMKYFENRKSAAVNPIFRYLDQSLENGFWNSFRKKIQHREPL